MLSRRLSRLLTSRRLRGLRHGVAAWCRRLRGAQPLVHYFHQADDPYSQLCAELLPALRTAYQVRLEAHLVPPPDAAAAPERERLQLWACRDASQLARSLGLAAPEFHADASPVRLAAAQQALALALQDGSFVDRSAGIGRAFWQQLALPVSSDAMGIDLAARLEEGRRLRQSLGHYLGATFFFEGEWYWGVDRLHYLERRLRASGLARTESGLVRPPDLRWAPQPPATKAPLLHFYCSLRSPYTYLAAARVRRLAEHHGAELRLRFVLPMVMRGLPVPSAKRRYILADSKREAEAMGLPFGCIVDPVGQPTERGLAVLHRAIQCGRGPDFLASFLQGVFAEGIDAGSRRGLLAIAARAGLSAEDVDLGLRDPSWREVAQANRAEMASLGLWGVPSFRVDTLPAQWGQDRLWMIEQDLMERRI